MKNNRPEYLTKLLDFIESDFNDFSEEVKFQAKKMFLDLAGVICAGAKNNTAQTSAHYVKDNYPCGEYTILGTGVKTNLIGASLANGMAANALDLDDGYSLLRGHPGAGFFGALLTAAENSDCTYGEFLSAIVVAYELSIRQGYSIRDFYGWDHSSGSYGTFATAASVGKLLKLNRHEMEMALGIADFIMPVTPAKRSCYIPSTNKDGIYWGQHAGAQAVMMAKAGITGKNPVILDDKYLHYIDSLGDTFYFFDLYIKFYSCCRWAHSPIKAVKSLMNTYNIASEDIKKVDIYSFGSAGTLYKNAPMNEDEAQYNIIYPIVAQILFGNCGPLESSSEKMYDDRVEKYINLIEFHHEPEYDKMFPEQRLSRAEITLIDGTVYRSEAFEPDGDHNSDVTIEDLTNKIHSIDGCYNSVENINTMINAILNTEYDMPFKDILKAIQNCALENKIPEIKHV